MIKEDEKYIEEIYKKMDDLEFNDCNLHELINFIKGEQRGKIPEFKKITNDDIGWLNVHEYLLKKIEAREKSKDHNIIPHEWQTYKLDFDKLKATIDDVELYGIIKRVQWTIGGGCYYSILDSTKYKQFLYGKIREIMDKFHPEVKAFEFDLSGQLLDVIPLTYDQVKVPLEEEKQSMLLFRTNLKRIEKPLKETVEHLDGIITQDEIENWIQQFNEDEEQILCLKLLKNIRFYNNKQIRQMCKTCHSKLLFDLDREKSEKIIFIPVGKPGKSGNFLIYLYRLENHLKDSQIVEFDNIEEQSNYDTIVFIDDLIGTGEQFSNFIDKSKLEKYKSEGKKIYYLALVGFEDGISRIIKDNKINIKTAQKLTTTDLPLSKQCDILEEGEKTKAKEILQEYGGKLFKDNSLGFQNFGALVAFDYRTPNITFPIFWSDAKGWFPVFKRYSSSQ